VTTLDGAHEIYGGELRQRLSEWRGVKLFSFCPFQRHPVRNELE